MQTSYFIEQDYCRYTTAEQQTWRHLYARMVPSWRRYAIPQFQRGLDTLALDPEQIPRLEDVNRFLAPLTGFRARAVSGYVPAFVFFDCLRSREFPTTITVRKPEQMDYLPEPDIFHDIAGHVPMHTDAAFADALVGFGECASAAADCDDRERLTSRIRAMARFFWFTVEFGLMRSHDGLRAYGSGLLSSHGELRHALVSPDVQRSPISLDWVIHQSFAIDRYQPLLFVVDSFAHLYRLVGELESWMRAGKLDHVAPGEPDISQVDLDSFLCVQADCVR